MVWTVTVLDLKTKQRKVRKAKILVSAVGALSMPKKREVQGKEELKGHMVHFTVWDHSFD